jgi:2-keto-4-pentenoate hydratase/2-oxohepta-3-ene-1,7-dioic acid hydratase in catechol pathway
MRLATCTVAPGSPHERTVLGAVVDGGLIDVGARLGESELLTVLRQGRLGEARRLVEGAAPDHDLAEVRFERPVDRPGKILCIGVNYGGRNAEYADGGSEPRRPSVFVRFPSSLTGHEQALVRPPESEQLDYEGEIVAVIGRAGRRIGEDRALDHVAGLTLGNEGTIRDWVRHGKFNVTQGKNWDRSGSIGPWLVPLDEVGDVTDLRVVTRVNGEVRQDDTTATMAFPIAHQIAYLSTFTTLEPGDVIFTGTPTGAGARFDPPRWLVPGDVVEVEVAGLGVLRNPVADEVEVHA